MAKLLLTRFLYIFDEVCISFLTSLLKKQDLGECYFWIAELYLSGYYKQSWDLIWFIYYDFYYIHNPLFEEYLSKKHKEGVSLGGDNGIKAILSAVKNMFKLVSSPEIFITRQYNQLKEITSLFRGKKPVWLSQYPCHYHAFLRYIDKKMYHFAVSCIPSTINDELLQVVKSYFNVPDEDFTLLTSRIHCTDGNNEHGNNENDAFEYDNQFHKFWSLVCLLSINPSWRENCKRKIYTSCTTDEHNKIMSHYNDPIPLSSKYNNKQIYKTLLYKRTYSITPLCSSFHLTRDSFENIYHELWYRWEYHAYPTPLWMNRFNQHKIIVDDDKQAIEFLDDDAMEEFYRQYGYEPDEQSVETQERGLYVLEENNWKHWYTTIFHDNPMVSYKDDFKFAY